MATAAELARWQATVASGDPSRVGTAARELAAARTRWAATAETTTEIPVSPYKKDVHAALFGVAWFPYYLLPDGGELPAFAQEQS